MISAPRRGWLIVPAAGCVLVALAWYLPGRPAAVWLGGQLFATGVVAVAFIRRGALRRAGWWALLAAGGVGVVSAGALPGGDRYAWAWVAALAVRYALLVAGVVLVAGRRRSATTGQAVLDAGIICAGLAVVGWTFLAEPALTGSPAGFPHPGVTLTYATLDLLMLAALVRVTAGEPAGGNTEPASDSAGPAGRRPVGMLLLVAAGALVVAADAVTILGPAGGSLAAYRPGGLVHLAEQFSGILVATAAWTRSRADRRSAGTAVEDGDTAAGGVPPVRLVVFAAVALLAPVVPMLGLLLSGGHIPAGILPAMAGSTVLSAVLVVLLVIRLGLVARLAGHRARAMKVQAAALVVQSTALQQALEEQQALQRELAHRALHDPLTGLANRALLLERLEQALADPTGKAGALLLLDLDGFKDVNNTLGHPAGDEVLVLVADRLRAAAGDAHTVARLGGDEFAVLMAGADEESCWRTAERVMEALRRPFPLAERQIQLAASGGMLPLGPDRPCPIATLRDADLALYAAKKAGKNQVVEFRPQMREDRLRYAELAAGVRGAAAGDALTILYQPIVELATGRPVAVEALVRWRAPDGWQVPPHQFISVAEEIGLVGDIGARVLRDACARASAWHRRYAVALSVNVSGRQVAAPGFAESVLAVLDETALPPEALILELTESVLVGSDRTAGGDGPATQECLRALRRHGVRVAVDDFGTGHSSLSYLHRLPIDMLKLDRAFTATLDSAGAPGAGFVGALLGLGAGLGVPTVSEGVENSRQADLLRELSCPLAQGYHFSAPSPADQVSAYLEKDGRLAPARA